MNQSKYRLIPKSRIYNKNISILIVREKIDLVDELFVAYFVLRRIDFFLFRINL